MKPRTIAAIAVGLLVGAHLPFALAAVGRAGEASIEGKAMGGGQESAAPKLSCDSRYQWPAFAEASGTAYRVVKATSANDSARTQTAGRGLMSEGRSEPKALAMLIAGLALMGFVVSRRQSRDGA